jgi:photosystem II stability/assembly factor-like uncharacterized protein
MMSIGDLAVAPSNPNVIWAGTGEANNRQSSSWGDGVYRSLDAGRTWKAAGLAETRHIGRVLVHPSNPDVVYVAAVGHLWGSNSERGVFKTTDGGQSWTRVLHVDDHTGATDVVMDPDNPETLFAATYQRQRKAWGFNGGGPGSGIYRTRDGGANWTKLSTGLPGGDKGRIGLDIFAGDSRLVYAVVEAAGRESGVYRSTDGGDTWEAWSSLNPRPMYYSQIRTDPKDPRRVYLLGSNRGFYISDDGGKTFRDVFSTVHSEDHALWIDPADTNHLISRRRRRRVDLVGPRRHLVVPRQPADSGSSTKSAPTCRTRTRSAAACRTTATGACRAPRGIRPELPIATASISAAATVSTRASIRPTRGRRSSSRRRAGRTASTWRRSSGRPFPLGRCGQAPTACRPERQRWNWNTPIVMSGFDPKVLYMGSHLVFRSADRGMTWTAISPDLTANVNRESLPMMGGPGPGTGAVEARRPDLVLHLDHDCRIAAGREAALHRQRRRSGAGDEGRRPEMDQPDGADPWPPARAPTSAASRRPATWPAACT